VSPLLAHLNVTAQADVAPIDKAAETAKPKNRDILISGVLPGYVSRYDTSHFLP
jgi:hypothetical protein